MKRNKMTKTVVERKERRQIQDGTEGKGRRQPEMEKRNEKKA